MMNKPDGDKVLERFAAGKEFTEELLGEYEALRTAIARLQAEKRELEFTMRNTDMGMLRTRIEMLEKELAVQIEENRALYMQFAEAEGDNHQFAERYAGVEKQNSDLVNLYVASLQLHSPLNFAEVLPTLKDVVINMVGSEDFAIYLKNPGDDRLRIVGHFGIEGRTLESIASGDARSSKAAQSGELYVQPLLHGQRDNEDGSPIACIPLHADGKVYGVITIYSLLRQKDGFLPVDFDLFELLGNHAATALIGAKLFAMQKPGSDTDSLDEFIALIGRSPKPAPLSDPRV